MRIIGGEFRGLTLAAVGKGDMAAHLRPTSDRVRESIFNLLMNGGYAERLRDARVLDLFAGTGALGIEAVSRGAAFAALVDNGRVAGDLIRRNLALCRLPPERAILLRRDATRPGRNELPPFDLVFADPPYGKGLGAAALAAAQTGGWLSPGALAVVEEAAEMPPPQGFRGLDARRYGDSWITLLELA